MEITTKKRNALPAGAFALPAQRKFPIHDRAHTANAAARLAQAKKAGTISDVDYKTARAAIRRAAKKFGIKTTLSAAAPSAAGSVGIRAQLGPGGHLHVRHMDDGEAVIFLPHAPICGVA